MLPHQRSLRSTEVELAAAEHSFLLPAKRTRQEAESGCIDSLIARDIERACAIASQFNRENGRPFDATAAERLLALIFAAAPRILRGVTASELQVLRVGAAMMELWGTNRCTQWLPSGFRVNLALDIDAAARMVLYSAISRRSTSSYRESGMVGAIEWCATAESCPACTVMAGRRFPTDAPPELPYEHCTHPMGCRCVLVPVVRRGDTSTARLKAPALPRGSSAPKR